MNHEYPPIRPQNRRVHEPPEVRDHRRARGMFFMVWCPETWAPVSNYGDAQEAYQEAMRLKMLYPEQDFYVMAAIARFEDSGFYTIDAHGKRKRVDEAWRV